MNKHYIRNLVKKSGIELTSNGFNVYTEFASLSELEKFAELIVKKCAYLVNHQQRTTGYTTHAKMLCDEFGIEFKDEDYFGVEE